MVKIKGPMGSAEASGSFGGSAVFSTWKGRSYVRTKGPPTNPKTGAQVSARQMLTFLAQQWAALTPPQKATWETLAAQTGIAPYNAFCSINLERWTLFKAPGKVHPITALGTLPSATFDSATGGVAHADLHFDITNERDWWALLIFRGQSTPVVPGHDNLIAVAARTETGSLDYTDQALDPGTYYWQARFCTFQGKMGPNETQRSAIVT